MTLRGATAYAVSGRSGSACSAPESIAGCSRRWGWKCRAIAGDLAGWGRDRYLPGCIGGALPVRVGHHPCQGQIRCESLTTMPNRVLHLRTIYEHPKAHCAQFQQPLKAVPGRSSTACQPLSPTVRSRGSICCIPPDPEQNIGEPHQRRIYTILFIIPGLLKQRKLINCVCGARETASANRPKGTYAAGEMKAFRNPNATLSDFILEIIPEFLLC